MTTDTSFNYQTMQSFTDNNNINDKPLQQIIDPYQMDYSNDDDDLSIDLRTRVVDEDDLVTPHDDNFEKSQHQNQSSRRKQSKPFRVQHSDDITKSLQIPQVNRSEASASITEADLNKSSDKYCDLCPEQFSTYMSWKLHQKDAHGLDMTEQADEVVAEGLISDVHPHAQQQGSDTPYLTEYHRLGSQLTNETALPEMPPLLSEKHLAEGVAAVRKDNNLRTPIFHQNAYCDFCDLEFCNKYFLRTHMATTHGVLEDDTNGHVPNGNLVMDLSSEPPQVDHRKDLPVSYSSALTPRPSPTTSASPVDANRLSLPSIPSISPPTWSKQRFPELIPTKTPSPPRHDTTSLNEARMESAEKKLKGPEDFCELCQKHFCNKYYLRKHKIDVHGIHSDPFSVKRRLSNQNMNNVLAGFPTSFPSMHNMSLTQSLPNMAMANMMLLNPFGLPHNPSMMQPIPGMMPLIPPPEGTTGLPEIEAGEIMLSLDAPADGMRGVQCSACKKHFIDGYFLSVHMMNKHAKPEPQPLASEPSPKDTKSDTTHAIVQVKREDTKNDTDCVDDEPLTKKIKREPTEATENPVDYSKIPGHHRPIPPDPFASIPMPRLERPRTCDLCHKEFADKYSLRMHKLNIHAQILDKSSSFSESKFNGKVDGRSSGMLGQNTFAPSSNPMSFSPSSMSIPSLGGMSLTPNGNIPDAAAMSTMFTSMVTAKLADRVTCDICNKEVCNKYFLKTHKVKMHGVDPATIKDTPREQKSKTKPINGISRSLKQLPPNFLTAPLPVPNENFKSEDLLKMGIDPEAYCEICKKEFCSKYFLRTHKLNMHGIPTDKPGNRKEDREISRRELFERELMTRREFGYPPPAAIDFGSVYPSMLGRLSGPGPVVVPVTSTSSQLLQTCNSMSPPLPALTSSLLHKDDQDSLDSMRSGDSKSSRSAANTTLCNICNMDLCNKDSLKVHKFQKHGILDDGKSDNHQRKTDLRQRLPLETPFFMNGQPEYKSNEVKENVGSFFGDFEKEFMKKYQLSPTSQFTKANDKNVQSYTHICNICQRRFTSVEWLKTHMHIEHNVKNETLQNELRKKLNDVCQICGMVFHDKDSLQSHLRMDHYTEDFSREESIDLSKSPGNSIGSSSELQSLSEEARIPDVSLLKVRRNLISKYTTATNKSKTAKIYNCSYCFYSSRWVANVRVHEEHRHGVLNTYTCSHCLCVFSRHVQFRKHKLMCKRAKAHLTCPLCLKLFQSRKLYRLHMLKTHQKHSSSSSLNNRLKSGASELTNNGDETQTPLLLDNLVKSTDGKVTPKTLEKSIRSMDITANGNGNSKSPQICYTTDSADLKSTTPPFFMQPFTLRDETIINQFVNAVVYLPVFEKINEPLTVHFQLTPTGQ